MNDLKTVNGRPTPLAVGADTYDVYPLTLADWGDLQAWVETQLPDPFAIAREQMTSGAWSQKQQEFLLRVAAEIASKPKPRLGSPEADAIVNTPAGQAEILYLSIRRGRPGFSRADATDLYARMMDADLLAASIATTAGMVVGDPKGSATGTPTPT